MCTCCLLVFPTAAARIVYRRSSSVASPTPRGLGAHPCPISMSAEAAQPRLSRLRPAGPEVPPARLRARWDGRTRVSVPASPPTSREGRTGAETWSDSGRAKFPLSVSPAELADSAGCDPHSAHRAAPRSRRGPLSPGCFPAPADTAWDRPGSSRLRWQQSMSEPPLGICCQVLHGMGYVSRAPARPVESAPWDAPEPTAILEPHTESTTGPPSLLSRPAGESQTPRGSPPAHPRVPDPAAPVSITPSSMQRRVYTALPPTHGYNACPTL